MSVHQAILFAGVLATGCSAGDIRFPDMSASVDIAHAADLALVDLTQFDLGPLTTFQLRALPVLLQSCAACHNVAQGSVPPFLVKGMEYQSITTYKAGLFLNVPVATQSLLLTKGSHTGPSFSAMQNALVQSWLESELAAK